MSIDKAPQNKMIDKADADTKDVSIEHEYFFPEYNKTVMAVSQEVALAKIINSSDNKAI